MSKSHVFETIYDYHTAYTMVSFLLKTDLQLLMAFPPCCTLWRDVCSV
jgi:hypothetical protein